MALYRGFCGDSNPTQSVIADGERTVNWYKEIVQSQAAPTGAALYPTPGQSVLCTSGSMGTRALWQQGSRAFAVIGDTLYEVSDTWALTNRGTVKHDANPATISYSGKAGDQLFITSGGNGYCYDLSTNTLTQVLTGEATMGGMLNSRFLAFNANTGAVRCSDLNDGLTWNPLGVFYREQGPDPWVAMIVRPPEIWLLGEQSGEVWYQNNANIYQPFGAVPGAFFTVGCRAPWSVAQAGNVLTWLARTSSGQGQIVAASGYTPQPISTYAVETQIGQMARSSKISDCEVLVYLQEGHLFACFNFATAQQSWVTDFSMGNAWHERGTWNSAAQRYDVWGPRVHGFLHGTHVVGDRATGKLSKLDITLGTDTNGVEIRRLRIGPPLWVNSSMARGFVTRFELIAETGLGLVTGQGSDPQVMLRTSTDGHTWSSERMASAGKIGEFRRRILWNRCGSSQRLWMPEVVVSDPIPWRLSGASLEQSGFSQVAQEAQG